MGANMRSSKTRFSLEQYQNKGLKAIPFILLAGLTFAVGLTSTGCSLKLDGNNNNDTLDNDNTSSTVSNDSDDKSVQVSDSSVNQNSEWSDIQDASFNVKKTSEYVKSLCTKYGKNVSSATIEEVSQLSNMLCQFSTVSKADLNKNDTEKIKVNKDIIIDANKVDAELKSAKDDIKAEVKKSGMSDVLMDLSTDYKICKELKVTCKSNDIKVGDKVSVVATCLPSNADVDFEYIASNRSATVDNKGVVKAISAGDVKITVKDKNTGVLASVNLNIKAVDEVSKDDKKTEETSKPKDETSSKPKEETSKPKDETSKPKEETSKPKDETSSKPKEETSKPTETHKDEVKATGVTLDRSSLSLTVGSGLELNAYILWSNNTSSYQGIQWSSSNTSVATVSSSGYVTAKSAGTATITASYGSYSKSCTVTVKAAQSSQPSGGGSSDNGGNGGSGNGGNTSKPSDGGNGGTQTQPSTPTITIKYRNDAAIEVGKENYVRPSVYKGNEMLAGAAGNYNITYKSSNTSIATIDSEGNVKGISVGTCTITATYGSSTTSCTLTVKAASGGGSSSTKDEYYYDEFGNRYSTTWVESEHEAFKTKTRKGYTIWECPEMVTIINEYRAKEGKSPLYWYSSDKAKAATLKNINRNLDEFKIACPEWFNSDGSFNFNEYCKTVGQGCRDNCEYHMDGHSDPHGSNYSSNVAECVYMSTGKYGVRWAVETWMNSPAHRAYIMKLEGSVYICHNGYDFYLS